MKRNFVLAAAILAVALPAAAQRPPAVSPFYLGAGIGQGKLNVSGPDLTGLSNASVDDTNTTYTIRAGWRASPYWAIEVGYYDLGKYQFHGQAGATTASAIDGEAKAKSMGVSLVGILPMDALDLYARLGYARSELQVSAGATLVPTSVNTASKQNEATYGVGARWNMAPNWGIFAEWMKNDQIEVDSYVFGVDFRF
jgi:OmpA-OmpF porin, OOP family